MVAVVLGRSIRFVTIEREGGNLGRVALVADWKAKDGRIGADVRDSTAVEQLVMVLAAGLAAEVVFDKGTTPTGCDDDLWRAWQLSTAAGHRREGFEQLVVRTVRVLQSVWPCVEDLAAERLRHRTLNGRAVKRFVFRHLGLRRLGVAVDVVAGAEA